MRWEGTFGAFCGVLRAESVESSYLGYFVQSESVRTTWSAAAGGTNINNLKRSDIETTRLLLPPVPEQHRIVAAIEEQFSRLDAGVASLQRAKRNLQRMRASVLTVAVEGRLVEPDADPGAAAAFIEAIRGERAARPPSRRPPAATTEDDDAAAPPAGWTSAALSDLSAVEPHAITDGPFGSNLKTEHYTESGPRVIRLQNIGDGRFVDDEAHISLEHFQRLSAHNVEAGDLLIALLGSELPRCCLVPPHVPPAIVKADCVRFRIHPRVNGRFLNLFLNSPPLRRRVSSRLHGVGRPRLNLGEIRSIQIPVPSAAEQQRIVEEVDRQFSVLEAMETALNSGLARAEGLRQAILREAFAGRLVPQDPSDEPASALLKSIGKEVTE